MERGRLWGMLAGTRRTLGGLEMKRYLVALAALPLLFACTPRGGNNTAVSSSSSASAQAAAPTPMTVQQAAQAFGLIGDWAPDCSQPASQENEHAVYALQGDGTVSLAYNDGPGIESNRYTWNQGLVIQPNELQLDGVFLGNNQAQHTVLQKNEQGQLRVFGNVDGTGKILVENGAFPSGGSPPWESRCGDRQAQADEPTQADQQTQEGQQ